MISIEKFTEILDFFVLYFLFFPQEYTVSPNPDNTAYFFSVPSDLPGSVERRESLAFGKIRHAQTHDVGTERLSHFIQIAR